MKKVLIVDDEENIRYIVKELLDREGYKIYEAQEGEEALRLSLEIKPDVMLLDVMMPKMTGHMVAKALKEKKSKCKIIMFSAKAQKYDIQKGLATGADYYLTKPFDIWELLDLVDKAMGKRN